MTLDYKNYKTSLTSGIAFASLKNLKGGERQSLIVIIIFNRRFNKYF